jgi:hypothetical protein
MVWADCTTEAATPNCGALAARGPRGPSIFSKLKCQPGEFALSGPRLAEFLRTINATWQVYIAKKPPNPIYE